MDELDEVSRRALLIKAREALEKEYQQAEADKKSLNTQIDAKRKELREVIERVEVAQLQATTELQRIANETVRERERLQAQNETLKTDIAVLLSRKNQEETAYRQMQDSYISQTEARRATLADVSSRVLQEEVKLRACQESVAAIKRTLAEADL
jgi:hypothetical protein